MPRDTERLSFRPWEDADAEILYSYAKDPDVGHPAGWPAHKSVEDSLEIIQTILSERETFAIILKETGEPIGSIGLHMESDIVPEGAENECELGYWIGKPYWGQGLTPEAAQEMLRYAFEDLGMKKVWCGYYEGNERSHHVQLKCGFVYQWTSDEVPVTQMLETRRGHVSCLTKEQWLANQA